MRYITLLCLIFISTTMVYSQEKPFVKQEILIQLHPDFSAQEFVETTKQTGYNFNQPKLLSKNMNIYLLSWDNSLLSNASVINSLSGIKGVLNIQNNHLIKERETIPSDPQFDNTWYHKNTGQTGGTNDNDIDTPDAWDITTGGTTSAGDEIVVCVLEGGGANMNHPDISANIYVNTNEIPNNNIDDDGNGYIDDINGWNTGANADNHNSGNHGTQVMGMIGASANDIGSVGVNHNVSMMLVSGFGISESGVIAAYDYPLTQRKLYNQTNGSNGAFVVVTNASWGIDGANPANYPLWCAYYDTLGIHGILNAGATTNSNFNVDTGGDMPTACGSDYMISVTASNHNDQRTFSGYGATTIDLAAPGENVLLPSGSNSYGTTNGTSFASPCVAGAIALAYSSPCPGFSNIYATDPQAGANYIRLALLSTVDLVPSLSNECVTGGRLNVNNMIGYIMSNCSGGNCFAPYSIDILASQNSSAEFSIGSFATDNYIYYQEVGNTDWDSLLFTGNNVSLNNLGLCTNYNIRFAGVCSSGISNYSDTVQILTEGCCDAPGVQLDVTSNTDISVAWNTISVGTSYDLEYAISGSSTWTTVNNVSSPYSLSGLSNCTEYDIRMLTQCSDSVSNYSTLITEETAGCGSCTEVNYCDADGGNTQYEYIQRVKIGPWELITGDDNGYRPTQNSGQYFNIGSTYTIGVQPGYTGGSYTEQINVWIDYNQNGSFESTELVMDETANSYTSVNVTIPQTAVLGRTRVRIISYGSNGSPIACQTTNYWGEVEDYCVNIQDNASIGSNDTPLNLVFAPNPTSGSFNVIGLKENAKLKVYTLQGRLVIAKELNENDTQIDLANFDSGVYMVIIDVNGNSYQERIIKK